MKEFTFPTRSNTAIHCCKWLPQKEPVGVVQIVHGISEYIARYDPLAQALTKRGFIVVGEDHMGHGGSISKQIPQGTVEGGWLAMVSDTYRLYRMTREEFPDLPYFLYGHSMGSFLTRTLLYTYPDAELAGAILSGTGWMPKAVLKSGRAVCRFEARRCGEKNPSRRVSGLMFGSYTKGIENPRTPFDWLSRDAAEVDKYVADPLLGFEASVGLSYEMLGGMLMNEDAKNLAKMPKKLPVLFVSGDKDPVGSSGKGVKKTYEAFLKAGLKDVQLKLYPGGRHEMHNEINREGLIADVAAWLKEHI